MPTSTDDRDPLDRSRILAAGIELADAHGADGLSMRKLARHLGFEVMSLYNHVRNKTDLLEGMVDVVAGEIEPAPPGAGWREAVRHLAMSAHHALLRHRWAATLWSSSWPGPHRLRVMEELLQVLADAELPDDVADLAFHAITLHISGFTQQQITYRAQSEDGGDDELMTRFRDEVPAAEYPRMHDHVRYHVERDAGRDEPLDEFGFVLDLILDGLEHARIGAAHAPAEG